MNTTALGLRPASEPDRNIVLVGRTGNGKSSTGNSLLGEKMFLAKRQAAGVTLRCEMRTAAIQDGSIINVIDTPGLFDFAVSADFLSREITKCLDMAEEGLHAVLFVLSARTRISQEDESTINALQVIFGSKMFDYMIVVFTGGDELKEDNSTLEEYLSEGCPEFLKTHKHQISNCGLSISILQWLLTGDDQHLQTRAADETLVNSFKLYIIAIGPNANGGVAVSASDSAPGSQCGGMAVSGAAAAVAAGTVQPGTTSLYVGDLDVTVTGSQMFEAFSQAGQVVSVRVCRDMTTQRSLGYGYGYVNYATQDASRALNELNFMALNGRAIRVMYYVRDPSGVGNIFIKNLGRAIDHKALHETFSAFGPIPTPKDAPVVTRKA
ncbi:unnamed protein product [Microthlaspi erraticum]|uniref:AIG1-type G domain-containing protein n=1 Tax=Microthlaspi erraticum TaxID=1685480 RepID=A0A6D2HRF2_9BRAS|nr:unnamed protein product [Microthlaspi erraticum]